MKKDISDNLMIGPHHNRRRMNSWEFICQNFTSFWWRTRVFFRASVRHEEAFSRVVKPATQQGVFINIFSVRKEAWGGAVKRQFPRAGRRAVISGMGKTATAGARLSAVYTQGILPGPHICKHKHTFALGGKRSCSPPVYIKRPWNCWCVLPLLWPRAHEKKIFSFPRVEIKFSLLLGGVEGSRQNASAAAQKAAQ